MSVSIGIPLPLNYQADARTVAISQGWTQGNEITFIPVASPSPEEGRDKIVSAVEYMVPKPEHILFLDADVVPRKSTLRVLMSMDKDIACGVYPMCQDGKFVWSVNRGDGFVSGLPQNPFKVESCGFGVVLVKTLVLEKMDWPYWRTEYKPGHRVLGEDIYFCHKARKLGFDIWCDPKVKCDHITRSSYLSILRNLK